MEPYKEILTAAAGTGKAIFLDRDGTVNTDEEYITKPEDLAYYPGALETLRTLAQTDYSIIIITNQGGIGCGYYTLGQYRAVMQKFVADIAAAGGRIDAHYCCPHAPRAACACRKPGTAMLEAAIRDFGLDPAQCAMIGDRTTDVEAGRRAGLRHNILLLTGNAGKDGRVATTPTYVAKDLSDAIEHITRHG